MFGEDKTYDRITQILQSQSTPQNEPLGAIQSANAFLSSLNGGDYTDISNERRQTNYNNARQVQQDTIGREMDLLKVFEAKRQAGDAQAEALAKKIDLFTNGDPEGTMIFLEALHSDPEEIDAGNSYQVMTKLAKIAKQTGYQSPDMKKKQTMDAVNNEILKRIGGSPDGPLSVRNNNPGNMRPVGKGEGFQAFSSPEEGLQAMQNDLLLKINGKSKAMEANFGKGYQPTLANVIATWAPSSENDTQGYVNFVAQKTGLQPDQVLSPMDVKKLIPAMIEMEGGQEAAQYYQTAPTGTETADSGQIMNDGVDEMTQLQVVAKLAEGDTEGALKLMADAQKGAEPQSAQGKLESDYRKGLITKETYDATVKKENADVEGVIKAKKSFDTVLDKISEKLDFLDKEGAIVNQNKDPLGPDALYNMAVNVGNTAIGQAGARMIGTKAQGARDSIVSLKRTLTPLLMKATGMSSQQLNSNVELMTFLDSLGNPQSSLQTNKEIIETLRQLYGSGAPSNQQPAQETGGWGIERAD